MLHTGHDTPTVSTIHWPGYYWRGEWVPEKSLVTTGYLNADEFYVHGTTAGDDLRIIMDGCPLDLPDGVTDHAGAVAWCERQFVRKPVTV